MLIAREGESNNIFIMNNRQNQSREMGKLFFKADIYTLNVLSIIHNTTQDRLYQIQIARSFNWVLASYVMQVCLLPTITSH